MRYPVLLLLAVVVCSLLSCSREIPDRIYYNGNIYTVDAYKPQVTAFSVKDGRILETGSDEEILAAAGRHTEKTDLGGRFVMPGFIEGHAHFSALGKSLLELDFLAARDWDEIVAAVAEAAARAQPGEWIEGRGWHQEKWRTRPSETVSGYPLHTALSKVSPDNPVLLRHASGHSLLANEKAMQLAGVARETPDPSGGTVVRSASGEAIGVFEERAMHLISDIYEADRATMDSAALAAQWLKGIRLAEDLCLLHGVTSFQDAGSSFEELSRFKALAEAGDLRIRLWAMVRHDSRRLSEGLAGYPVIGAGDGHFTCRAIKSELDGALGVFGAWKLRPYADKPGSLGHNTTSIAELRRIADLAIRRNMQLCVHAIGDRANREYLNLCDSLFAIHPDGKKWRWRSEHAQHLDTSDILRFRPLGIIAAMQAIHCTSDAPFVVQRLGYDRAHTGAYAWRSLLDAGVIVGNGTDAPVEPVDPIASFYASVTRKRKDTGQAFFPEQAMTREEAIYSYTMANAYAAFEDGEKGSITPGKRADFIVLSNDLIRCPEEAIPATQVLETYMDGKLVYIRKQ